MNTGEFNKPIIDWLIKTMTKAQYHGLGYGSKLVTLFKGLTTSTNDFLIIAESRQWIQAGDLDIFYRTEGKKHPDKGFEHYQFCWVPGARSEEGLALLKQKDWTIPETTPSREPAEVHDFEYVSVSQGKHHKRCNRSWGFDKINKVPRKTTDAQDFGLTGHTHAEAWIKNGTMPPDTPEGNAFKQGIKKDRMPPPKSANVYTEEKFTRPLHEVAEGLIFLGYIDIIDGRDPTHTIVIDHKFTKDLRYAMDEEELSEDYQAVGYARVIFDQSPDVQKVTVRWLYYAASGRIRKPKGTRMVKWTFERGAAFDELWMNGFVSEAREIHHAKQTVKEAHELDPNPGECGAFGGCPYVDMCKIPEGSRMRAHFNQFEKTNKRKGQNNMGLFDKVKKRVEDRVPAAAIAGAPAPAAPAPAAPAPAPAPVEQAPAPTGGGLSGKLAQMARNSVVALQGTAKVTAPAKAAATNAAIAENDGVNPPEQHVPDGTTEPAPETTAEKKKREAVEKRAAKKAEKEAAAAAKKAEKEAAVAIKVVAKEETPTHPVESNMMVLINCLPVNHEYTVSLIELLVPAMIEVAEASKTAHWNLAPNGQGPALLATAFDEWLDENPVQGTVLVDSGSSEATAVMNVLLGHAALVIRGVK